MSKIRAVIFDMDGTLIDSREIVLGAFKHVLEEYGQEYDESIVSSHVGRLLDHTYQDLLPDQDIETVKELHRSWQAENKDLLKGYDGLDDFLSVLKRTGLKFGIFTSATRPRADLALDGLGIREYFDAIICGDEIERPKPDKEGVVKVAELLETPLDEVVMVGDAEHDIASGKNAGVITIGVTHGFGTKEALQKAGADYIVNNLVELQAKLEELGSLK